jgi:SAM-dependent methyltransferase
MERFLAGNRLQRCREAYLPQTRARSALVLGPGRGLFVEAFLQSNREASVVCLDSSACMLALTRDRILRSVENPNRVVFLRADVLDDHVDWLEENDPFDLVVSHFFLDCFGTAELEKVVSKVSACTSPSANWLIADFCIPTSGFWKWRAKLVLWMAYVFFRKTTGISAKRLANPEPALRRCGFELKERRRYNYGLLRSDVWRKESREFAPTI